MSLMMIEGDDVIESEIMLHDIDFPRSFVNKMHPDDGKIVSSPICPEIISHEKMFHNRIFLRISFKLSKDRYIPFTFVCDTGAPNFLYLSVQAYDAISHRIRRSDNGIEYISIEGRNIPINTMPNNHEKCNIIGLMLLFRMGLKLRDDNTFTFKYLPEYL